MKSICLGELKLRKEKVFVLYKDLLAESKGSAPGLDDCQCMRTAVYLRSVSFPLCFFQAKCQLFIRDHKVKYRDCHDDLMSMLRGRECF